MILDTVTCLVRAIGSLANVRSCVPSGGRSQSAPTVVAGGITGAARHFPSQSAADLQIQGIGSAAATREPKMLTISVGGSRTPGAEQIPRPHTADMRNFQPHFRFGIGIGSRWSLLSPCLGTHDGTQQLWNRSKLPMAICSYLLIATSYALAWFNSSIAA